MTNVIIAVCLSLAATASFAYSLPDGNWQGPCVAIEGEEGPAKSKTQTFKFHAQSATSGTVLITRTQFLDSKCTQLRFYAQRKASYSLSKSDLGEGAFNVDLVEIVNPETKLFDIVKFHEGEDGFYRAIFGEAASEEAAGRPTKFSTRDNIYLKFF